uniref:Uncharacterized protein n=1 Tax=Panagrolaimus davidi TaxID=227884 RepID=A0A914QLH2_9BILA
MSFICPKIYRCDIKVLVLQCQNMSYSEFLLISTNAEKLDFYNVTVKNEDASIVPLEKLVEVAVKVRYINLYFDENDTSITSETAKNLLKIPHFLSLEQCTLHGMPEVFDIETFCLHFRKNKVTDFDFRFLPTISQAHKERLEAIIVEIISTESHDFQIPMIGFDGQNRENYEKLFNLLR